jgi:methionyl-tRNA formyltransferase
MSTTSKAATSSGKQLPGLITFFGTGPVAAKSLELLSEWADIEAVITKPKPTHHKGSFPVLDTAQKLGLKTLTVASRRELDELMASKPVQSDLGVLIDFGIIVSQQVIDYFPFGIVNSHFSFLPEWRGADPISFSILCGQPQTGVSLMLLTAGLDEGPLLANSAPVSIEPDETTPSLTDKLITESDASLQAVLPLYLAGEAKAIDQFLVAQQIPGYPVTPTYSRKLTKDDSLLDFSKPAARLEREIRAYIEWPRSRTTIGDKEVIITKAIAIAGSGEPGSLWQDSKHFGFYTTDGILQIEMLMPAGKAEMSAQAFLNGYGSQL